MSRTLSEGLQPRLNFVDKVPVLRQHTTWTRKGTRGSPYASAALGLLEAEGHVGAILLGPYNERVCTCLAAAMPWARTGAYPAVSGSRRLWRCASRGVVATGRPRRGPRSSLPPAAVAQVSLERLLGQIPRQVRQL